MKKNIYIAAIASTFLLTSCSSGWNCKARYVKTDIAKKTETHRVS